MNTNLNNTPSDGPLTVEDLDAYRRGRPLGLDLQGRYPEAGHAASEIDDDEPLSKPPAVRWCGVALLAAIAISWGLVGAIVFGVSSVWPF